MFGLGNLVSIEDALVMLKPMFEKEQIKSILISLKDEKVVFNKYESDLIQVIKDICKEFPQVATYLSTKKL